MATPEGGRETNRLADETSPYLLQHAANPVHWYPWGPEALETARETGRPILLSVGYSACHWCHVMAHESFEDEDTAALMNKLFVNVKVDREERPDIDRIYQIAHQLIAQRPGGWPLTMFLTPEEQLPFFGGTYFPKEPRHGMPAFRDILQRVAEYFRQNPEEVRNQGRQLADIFPRLDPEPAEGIVLDGTPLAKARESLAERFDERYGGFGDAPKFPHPATLERLLRHWRASAGEEEPDVQALYMAALTLTRMAEGGLFDQIGGGFCRYSVDAQWLIPHFEKMLYDNGPLLALYAELGLAGGDAEMSRVAGETADWMLREMRAPGGGFYSSLDADSEGEEGRYYVWTPETARAAAGDQDFPLVAAHFGLDEAPNFEGRWHLYVRRPVARLAEERGEDGDALRLRIDRAREAMLRAREQRVRPGRDEKILTSWNALAIRGLAVAGRALARDDLIDAAAGATAFLRQELWRDGRLLATYKDGRARFPAYLDDHALLADALLELAQARWDADHLRFAIELAELLLAHFEDADNGGFFFTADDHEALLHRSKPLADEAIPSGNGIAARALLRLGFLLGEERYVAAAERTLRAAWQAMTEYPHGHVSLITALEEYLQPPELVILRGDPAEIGRWARNAAGIYAPRRLVFAIPAAEKDLPGHLALREPAADGPVAYICEGTRCSLPVTTWPALAALLGHKR
ncbi:thioredoxin domain-containing protein [Lentisalinibacter orientalis]|uniref:thioredoxin domain-containing protein n=1 Tax=Lentisalinibacter orientalis TaxID=2992241 RepID=UPI0038703EF6